MSQSKFSLEDDFKLGEAKDLMRGGRFQEALMQLYSLASYHPENEEIRGLIERCLEKQQPPKPAQQAPASPPPPVVPQVIVVQAPPPQPVYYPAPVYYQRRKPSNSGGIVLYTLFIGFWFAFVWAFGGLVLYLIPPSKQLGTRVLNRTRQVLFLESVAGKDLNADPPIWTYIMGAFFALSLVISMLQNIGIVPRTK